MKNTVKKYSLPTCFYRDFSYCIKFKSVNLLFIEKKQSNNVGTDPKVFGSRCHVCTISVRKLDLKN